MTAMVDDEVDDLRRANAELRRRLDERTRERDEALQRETATGEILQVINTSHGDLAPVFEAMLEKAIRLADATCGYFLCLQDSNYTFAAGRGLPAQLAQYMEHMDQPRAEEANARVLEGQPYVHILDCRDDPAYRSGAPLRRAVVDLGGMRTGLAVPLRKGNEVLGTFSLARHVVRPFSEKQIALVQNFAAQTVIAMENARLLGELQARTHELALRNSEYGERISQQSATIDVLKVMAESADDTQPVFDLIVRRASEQCESSVVVLVEFDGTLMHLRASTWSDPVAHEAYRKLYPRPPDHAVTIGRAVMKQQIVHIRDISRDPELSGVQGLLASSLAIPLLRDCQAIGAIGLGRNEVGGYSESQIELLQAFAEQAVIAIGSVATYRALQERTDELGQRQAELRITFENMGDGVALFDETRRLVAWNRKFQEILDVPDGVLADRLTFQDYVRYLTERGEFGPNEDPEAQRRRIQEFGRQHTVFERTRPNGRVIEVRYNPVPDGGFVLIYADITERKRNEAEIRAARDAAEEASRTIDAAYRDLKAAQANLIQAEKMASLGQLTAGIAHEIKNPLNFVNNFAALSVELLDELKETAAPAITALNDETRAEIHETIEMLTGNLEKIAEHGRRADNIVKGMLEHSRGSSGERRSVDLNGLIEEALNLAYHGGRAQDQSFNITLEHGYAQAMPPIELVPQDITRVCLNLFTNGFYATTKRQREGGDASFKPTLKVLTRDLGDAVEIAVRDNGTGIPPEIKDKLFQPFFTTKPTGEGTGLGLSISYDIVTQQHGGTIQVDSRVGEYTEFTVRLPRRQRTTMAEAAS